MQRRSERRIPASLGAAALALPGALLLGCTNPETRSAGTGSHASTGPKHPPNAAAALPVFHREDILWLERVTFGLDSASVAEYRRLGRERYLEQQLTQSGHGAAGADRDRDRRPRGVARRSGALPRRGQGSATKPSMPCRAVRTRSRRAKTLNESGNKLAYQAIRRELVRAVYSPSQLKEQMVWFWLNHFSVHQAKANLRWSGRRLRGARHQTPRARPLSGSGARDARTPRDAAIPRQRPKRRRPHQ